MKLNPAAFIGLFFTIAILLWKWSQPYSTPDVSSIPPPELPVVSSINGNGLLAEILSHNLWDKERGLLSVKDDQQTAQSANEQPSDAQLPAGNQLWTLLGVSNNKRSFAVIQMDGQIKKYYLGEQLPDGAKLIQIMPYGINIERLGKDEHVYLFGKK